MARRQREGENVMGTLRLGVRDRIYFLSSISYFQARGVGGYGETPDDERRLEFRYPPGAAVLKLGTRYSEPQPSILGRAAAHRGSEEVPSP